MELLSEWNTKLLNTYRYYNELIKNDSAFIDNTCRFKVWYSHVIEKPKILFIGINPGVNEKKLSEEICISPVQELEYLAENSTYRLANQIKKAFELAGKSDMLKNSAIKTNYYHLITDTQGDLKRLNWIQKGLFNQYDSDSAAIIKVLIDVIKPEYIICEGKTIYNKMRAILPNEIDSNWDEGCGFTSYGDGKSTLLGFERRRSNIKNISAFSNLLSAKLI